MEQVIELSIGETNDLRAKLGIKPLRTGPTTTNSNNNNANNTATSTNDNDQSDNKETLSLSIEDSNTLRSKLGLAPLRNNDNNASSSSSTTAGRKSSDAIHAPATNTGNETKIRKRLEEAKLKKEVEAGIAKLEKRDGGGGSASDRKEEDDEEDGGGTLLGWADKMRTQAEKKTAVTKAITKKTKTKKKNKSSSSGGYCKHEMNEQDITVSHLTTDFTAGESTILTLADSSILTGAGANSDDENDENVLENINMSEDRTSRNNLKKKRQIEMGLGHAGGYAGYDDDEFEELGGSQMTLGADRGGGVGGDGEEGRNRTVGFKLGSAAMEAGDSNHNKKKKSDLFASMGGGSVSLMSSSNNNGYQVDFMDADEEEQEEANNKKSKRKKSKKGTKKDKKVFKKTKKKSNRGDKIIRRQSSQDDDAKDDEVDMKEGTLSNHPRKKNRLLEDLEESATIEKDRRSGQSSRKRNRHTNDDDEDDDTNNDKRTSGIKQQQNFAPQHQTTDMDDDNNNDNDERKEEEDEARRVKERTEKYNRIMEKGNKRTDAAFGTVQQQKQRKNNDDETNNDNDNEEEDADDAFLNAALAKARRMRRLRELNAKGATTTTGGGIVSEKRKVGADAVVQSIDDMQNKVHKIQSSSSNTNGGKNGNDESRVTFELDATKEFTRSLRALTTTAKVEFMGGAALDYDKASKSTESLEVMDTTNNERGAEANTTNISTNMDIEDDTPHDHNTDEDKEDEPSFEKLADQVQEDPIDATGFGSASTLPVGRGLANVLSMLKHTGEITGKNAGREEVRGRAKDERNYELYDPLDLKKVVTIDRTAGVNGATVHAKDLELANREIKYDHRDKHGRLLTQKEAYRDLCYQFHGYGSSKKNEERRLRQIERERAEKSITTRQLGGGGSGRTGAGTLGALKATQKATGKAFVLHKA